MTCRKSFALLAKDRYLVFSETTAWVAMALMLVRAHPSRRSSSSAAAMMAARVAASPLYGGQNGRDQMTGDVADKVWHFRDTAVSELGARSASPIGQRA